MGNNNSLHQAVLNNDIKFIEKYISCGNDLDVLDKKCRTALVTAVLKSNYSIAWRLVDEGANVNIGQYGYMLHHCIVNCIDNGPYGLSKRLIDKKKDLNIIDEDGNTALHIAFYTTIFEYYDRANEIAEHIIDNGGANLNIKNKDGYTPLYYAIINNRFINNNIRIVKKLIDKGADINTSHNNLTLLQYCIKYKKKDLVELLLSYNVRLEVGDQDKIHELLYGVDVIRAIIEAALKKHKEPEDIETDIEELQCIICTCNRKAVLFNDCRHVNTCYTCSKTLDKCPICRQQIKDKLYIYL